jgi:hypothetical protein
MNAQFFQFFRAVRCTKRPCAQQPPHDSLVFRALALGVIEDIFLLPIFVFSFVINTMIPKEGFKLPLSALPWKMTTEG